MPPSIPSALPAARPTPEELACVGERIRRAPADEMSPHAQAMLVNRHSLLCAKLEGGEAQITQKA